MRYAIRGARRQIRHPQIDSGKPSVDSLCALGKVAARKWVFASDIELLFIYAGNEKPLGRADQFRLILREIR